MEFYPHQLSNAATLVRSIRSCGSGIDASDTGTGKSLTALGISSVLELRPFVICPLSVGPAWVAKGKAIRTDVRWINYEKARAGNWFETAVRTGFITPETDLIIFDESHRIGAANTLQSKLAFKAKEHGFKTLQLSATPFDTPLRTRAALHLTGKVDWKLWQTAMERYGCYRAKWLPGKPWMWRSNRTDIKRLRDLLSDSMVATKWTEVEGFPELQIDCVPVTIRPADRKKIDDWRSGLTELNLGTTQKERVKLELARVPSMIDMTRDLVDQGRKVAAFFNFKEPLQSYCTAMKISGIDGETQAELREILRERFVYSGHPLVIAGNSTCIGEGIDLHDIGNGSITSLISPPYSARILRQLIGRTHRIGGVSRAVAKIIFAADTMEQTTLLPTVQSKMAHLETLKDKDLI
jgi:superfamily II DNA or RNA helicase